MCLNRQHCVLWQPLGLKFQRKQNSLLIEMRPSLAKEGEDGVGRNVTAAAKYWTLRSSTLLSQLKLSRDLVAR